MAETAVKLTPARRKALEVLARQHERGRTARVSGVTNEAGYVHWQACQWLRGAGLARGIDIGGGDESQLYVRITPAGLDLLGNGGP